LLVIAWKVSANQPPGAGIEDLRSKIALSCEAILSLSSIFNLQSSFFDPHSWRSWRLGGMIRRAHVARIIGFAIQ
jgi:hypothetical protein